MKVIRLFLYFFVVYSLKLVSTTFILIFRSRLYSYFLVNKPFIISCITHALLLFVVFYGVPTVSLRLLSALQEQVIVVDTVELSSVSNINIGGSNTKDKHTEINVKYTEKEQPNYTPDIKQDEEGGENLPTLKPIESKKVKETRYSQDNSKKVNLKDGNISENQLASVLKSINKNKNKERASSGKPCKDCTYGKGEVPYNKSKPITMSAIDAIRSKFIKCWNLPYGARNVEQLKVIIRVKLDHNGNVIATNIVNKSKYSSDAFFRAMADSAVRAVYKCSPIDNLPQDRYQHWSDMELNFDLRDMF